jgi:hypothetical protein
MIKPARKSAKPIADKAQAKRFIEAARDADASEDEAVFDENLKNLVRPNITPSEEQSKNKRK